MTDTNDTKVSAERLRELFQYEPDTGAFVRRVECGGQMPGARIEGPPRRANGYARISIDGVRCLAHRLAWLYVYGAHAAGEIDHVNRVRWDNRIANLRVVTHVENSRNREVRHVGASGVTGVSLRRGRWRARIVHERRWIELGSFATQAEAAAARIDAERRLWGVEARDGLR